MAAPRDAEPVKAKLIATVSDAALALLVSAPASAVSPPAASADSPRLPRRRNVTATAERALATLPVLPVSEPVAAPEAEPAKFTQPDRHEGHATMENTYDSMAAQADTTLNTGSAKMQDFVASMTERTHAATEKSMKLASEATAFQKANVEAIVESGKIAVEGAQSLSRDNVEYAKSNFETASNAMKDFAAVRSPTELFQINSDYARKAFDSMVQQGSKNSEAMLKLLGEAFQPVSNRMTVAMEKMKTAA